jgi:hypothetical protein
MTKIKALASFAKVTIENQADIALGYFSLNKKLYEMHVVIEIKDTKNRFRS